MLDRFLHHAHIVKISGESYRLKDKRKVGLTPTPKNVPRPKSSNRKVNVETYNLPASVLMVYQLAFLMAAVFATHDPD
jgi:hypothetical protein